MSPPVYLGLALFLAIVLFLQLASGTALGAWWYPRVERRERPIAYWLLVTAQAAILVVFLVTAGAWHIR